jgi:phosphohistidine phosphatase SixA
MNAAKVFARLALCGLFALLACHAPPAAAADEVWALLKKPGHIILLRHSNAPGNVTESNDMNFKDCSIQRNLDAEGRAQAARIGTEFRKRGIGVRLISSQYCRAVDTAKLTRLGAVNQNPVLNQVFGSGMSEAGSKGRALMKRVSSGPLTMLVTHVTNIQAMGGPQLNSGQMAVVHFDKSGEVVADGTITVP